MKNALLCALLIHVPCHFCEQGVEAIDSILEKLREEESGELHENDFKTFPRVVVRRLGRLLPDARGPDARAGVMLTLKVLKGCYCHCFARFCDKVLSAAGLLPDIA